MLPPGSIIYSPNFKGRLIIIIFFLAIIVFYIVNQIKQRNQIKRINKENEMDYKIQNLAYSYLSEDIREKAIQEMNDLEEKRIRGAIRYSQYNKQRRFLIDKYEIDFDRARKEVENNIR